MPSCTSSGTKRLDLGTQDSSQPDDYSNYAADVNEEVASGRKDTSRLVLADFVAESNSWRITMSVPLLNRGPFLVQGEEKAPVLHDVLLGRREPEFLPAQVD